MGKIEYRTCDFIIKMKSCLVLTAVIYAFIALAWACSSDYDCDVSECCAIGRCVPYSGLREQCRPRFLAPTQCGCAPGTRCSTHARARDQNPVCLAGVWN